MDMLTVVQMKPIISRSLFPIQQITEEYECEP